MQTCYVHVWQFRCALKNEMEENPKRNASLHVVVDTCRHGCMFGSWCTRISLLRQPPSTTVNIESRLFGRISNAMASINVFFNIIRAANIGTTTNIRADEECCLERCSSSARISSKIHIHVVPVHSIFEFPYLYS